MLHKVNIAGLAMDPASNTPIILLKTEEGDKTLPIWIGLLEATSIASALQDIQFDRPMTHDLFKNFLDTLKITISKVEVCDLRDNTFYARIHFSLNDESYNIDARPSDAIALALRAGCPIFVDEKVLEKSGQLDGEPEAVDTSDEGKRWKEYLEKLSPEDFGKYKM